MRIHIMPPGHPDQFAPTVAVVPPRICRPEEPFVVDRVFVGLKLAKVDRRAATVADVEVALRVELLARTIAAGDTIFERAILVNLKLRAVKDHADILPLVKIKEPTGLRLAIALAVGMTKADEQVVILDIERGVGFVVPCFVVTQQQLAKLGQVRVVGGVAPLRVDPE